MKYSLFSILILLFLISVSSHANDTLEEDVIGLSNTELILKYPEVKAPSNSFALLISKMLHPLRIPREHALLRYGKKYIVFELKNDVVIAVHRVSG